MKNQDSIIARLLVENSNKGNKVIEHGCLEKTDYNVWVNLEKHLFDTACKICIRCGNKFTSICEHISKSGDYVDEMFKNINHIFTIIGDINSHRLWYIQETAGQIISLILNLPRALFGEHKFREFRLGLEDYLAGLIIIQKAKSSEQLDEEDQERKRTNVPGDPPSQPDGDEPEFSSVEDDEVEPEFSSAEKNVLYVLKYQSDCEQFHHNVEKVAVIFVTLEGVEVVIEPAYHCLDCDIFFMSEWDYNNCIHKYGVILGNICFRNSKSDKLSVFAQEHSLLNKCGYNVNQQDNLSSKKRQEIIKRVIELGIMTKGRVLNLLEWLIKFHGSNPKNEIAKSKWQEDWVYTKRLSVGMQPVYRIKYIQKGIIL